jgi:hypothetical protein
MEACHCELPPNRRPPVIVIHAEEKILTLRKKILGY